MGSSLSSSYKAEQVVASKTIYSLNWYFKKSCVQKLFSEGKIQGKFDLKNVVINIVAGLGLLSFISMFCDFILLNYVNERFLVRKYIYSEVFHVNCRSVTCFNFFLGETEEVWGGQWRTLFREWFWRSESLLNQSTRILHQLILMSVTSCLYYFCRLVGRTDWNKTLPEAQRTQKLTP